MHETTVCIEFFVELQFKKLNVIALGHSDGFFFLRKNNKIFLFF